MKGSISLSLFALLIFPAQLFGAGLYKTPTKFPIVPGRCQRLRQRFRQRSASSGSAVTIRCN
jgi:hypothetical protein